MDELETRVLMLLSQGLTVNEVGKKIATDEETLADVKLIGGFYRNTKNTSVVEGIGKIVQSLEGK